MKKLEIGDLWMLEEYAEQRSEFRKKVIAQKKVRTVPIGPNLTLLFEDRVLIQYQVQEMLRIERIVETAGIQEELDAYNPLLPDGSNWKATCLVEFEAVAERQEALTPLIGIENLIWAQAGQLQKVFALADEDLDRTNEEETSAVHFLRFELPPEMVKALKTGAALRFGVDHADYGHAIAVAPITRVALMKDLTDK